MRFPASLHGSPDVKQLRQALEETLPGLLARVRPELVLYNAGVDVHADDALGKMALTDAGSTRNFFSTP